MKKFILGLFIGTAIVLACLIGVYYIYFRPIVQTTPITTPTTINEWNLTKKFIPKDIDLSLTELTAKSESTFSNDELTSLFINIVKESPVAMQYVTGLTVQAQNNEIIIYANINYNGIPLQAHLVFQCMASDGQGILHYKQGNIGLINIPKSTLFNDLQGNTLIQFDNEAGNIILHFTSIRNLDVQSVTANNGTLQLDFKYTLKFWDWLKRVN